MNGGDHGELAYIRESIQVFICVGVNVAWSASPLYTIHESLRPGMLRTTDPRGVRYKSSMDCGLGRSLLGG